MSEVLQGPGGSEKPVSQWTNDELKAALVSLGSTAVPITPSTRPFLEKKVVKLLLKKQQQHQEPVSHQDADDSGTSSEKDNASEDPLAAGGSRGMESTPQDGEFYCVVVEGDGPPTQSSLSPYYTNKSEVLRAIKSVPGARFKKFSSRASAEAFSSSPVDNSSRQTTPGPSLEGRSPAPQPSSVEKRPNLFPSVKTAELNRFRKLIETGDVSGFSREVWANPRHLVNCYGDAPEILHVGCRYNALHCAVKAGRLEICQELLSVLRNEEFWQLLYPNDSPAAVHQRRGHLVDLYLNMQDKNAGDTPLHFASKLGHLEIVKLLLSQPSLDPSLANKYDQRAADVVCQNAKSSSTEVKEKVKELINAPPLYYVPVLRAADNCTPPQLTPPCTISDYRRHRAALSDDRGTPVIGQAIAGPMSPAQAETFYQEWRSPSNSRDWREALQIKRSDSSRGFERVGRQLAEECDVGWREYWDFLGCYCNLHKSEGLQKLEQYLTSFSTPPSSPSLPPHSPPPLSPPPPPPSLPSPPPSSSQAIEAGVSESANVSRELFPSDEDCVEEVEGGGEGVREGDWGGQRCGKGVEAKLESVLEGVASLSVGGGKECGRREEEEEVDIGEEGDKVGGGEGGEKVEKGEGGIGEDERNNSPDEMETVQQQPPLAHTPTTSTNTSGTKKTTFILGSEPTKVDHDVYLAVRGAPSLSASHYPHVVDWINRVEGFSEHAQKSWRTPKSGPKPSSLTGSGGNQGSPLLVTSPPRSPLPRPPILPSPHSPPHRLHTSTLSPRRHFSPLHRSLNASSSTPSRLHRSGTPTPRQVLPTNTDTPQQT